jgi:DNA polymerase-3 subunit beta
MSGESSEEFPAVAEFKAKRDLEIDNNLLKRFISKTVFAVSKDELRPSMMGVLFQIKSNEFRAVATDGHRLVKVVNQDLKSHGFQKDLIIPEKALQLVLRSSDEGENKISISDTHVMFDFGNTVLVSRLIDEAYPNYESVIPLENEKKLTVNRSQLLSCVKRVSLYSSSATHQIRFSMSGKNMEVSAEDADVGGEAKENVNCDYGADEMEIGFNSRYIEDMLSHIDSEEVVFKFSSPTRAGIVEPSVQKHNEDVLMLVMPVRLNA